MSFPARKVQSIILLLLLLQALPSVSNAQNADSPLDEMRAIEAQIRAKLIEQSERDSRIDDLDQSLRLANEMMRGNPTVRNKNQKVLKGMEGSVKRDLSAIESAIADARQLLDHSRGAVQIASALTLQNARDRGLNDRKTTLSALLQVGHREQTLMAIEQSLKLEELKSSRSDKQSDIQSQVDRYAELAELPVDKLRARHRTLSAQLSKLNALSTGTQSTITQLESRRRALNELVEGLAAGTLTAAEIEKLDRATARPPSEIAAAIPSPEASPTEPGSPAVLHPSDPPPPSPDDIPEIPYDDQQTELHLGTRQGGGEALLTLDIPSDPSLPNQDGPRKSFWRAEPTNIHALADGKVLFGGAFAGYTHLLIVDHGQGWTCLYGNMQQCALLEGAQIRASQILGTYQTLENTKSEPFWIEVRHEAAVEEITRLPGAGENWESKLFGE